MTDGVGGAQSKYDDVHTANLNVDLTDLTPTAPEYDPNGATPADKFPKKDVGEALIVAPKDNGDYDMRVTIKQDVPLSWINTNDLTTKEVTYDLTIKAPDGGFKVNTSYNVILTVYSLQRIEVIAVITPWADNADDIEIGGDQ